MTESVGDALVNSRSKFDTSLAVAYTLEAKIMSAIPAGVQTGAELLGAEERPSPRRGKILRISSVSW